MKIIKDQHISLKILQDLWRRRISNEPMELKFRGKIIQNGDMDSAYLIVPYDIKKIYRKGRLLVYATFDGYPYEGQVLKMGSSDYIIGIRKDIRKNIGKSFGDEIEVSIKERKKEEKEMWTCPKCGRQFKNKNQSHSCSKKPSTIDEYIEDFDGEKKEALEFVYKIIKKELADAKEKISWSMPTFYRKKNIIHFAGAKNHLGIYPGPRVIENLEKDLEAYKTSKGAIQIPYDSIDENLIRKISREAKRIEEKEN